MHKKNEESSGSIVCGMLGIAFIVLKLCKVITWPWIWVLAPFWMPTAIVLSLLFLSFGVGKIYRRRKHDKERERSFKSGIEE